MKVYKVGILGFGFIGKVHAYGYACLPFYCDPPPLAARITHVITGRSETAEKARRLLGADVHGTDFRLVTEDPDVDIVHICTPNHLHAAALVSALRHGKHVYCDKPLAADWSEAAEIRAALADYRGTAQMTFHCRFLPCTMRAKQLLESGALGRILQFRAAYLQAGNADPNAPIRWKLTAAAGGGVIADLASHALDLTEWLLGPLSALSGQTLVAYAERPAPGAKGQMAAVDAEDCVLAMARAESGALGTLEATKLATGTEDELRVEIHGVRGALRINTMDPHHLEFYDATAPAEPIGGSRGWTRIDTGRRYAPPHSGFPTPKAAIGWERAHVACLANFLQAVAEGRPAEPSLAQGLRVQWLMDCLRRSAAAGRWLDVGD